MAEKDPSPPKRIFGGHQERGDEIDEIYRAQIRSANVNYVTKVVLTIAVLVLLFLYLQAKGIIP